jgi:hypothetical protein
VRYSPAIAQTCCCAATLFAATSVRAADDVIDLRPAVTTKAPAAAANVIPTLEILDEPSPSNGLSVTTGGPEPRTILNIPDVFSDGALGGVEDEALLIGPPGRWVPRVGAKYITQGVGYDDPFLFSSGFIPWDSHHGAEHELRFIELNGGISHNSEYTGSIESVSREYQDGGKRVKGGYWALDYRDSEVGGYRQLAFGDDWLGANRESRYNVYVPLGRNQKFASSAPVNVPIGTAQIPAVQTNFETAMYGADGEYGWRLVPLDKSSIWGLIGGYHFQAGGVTQVWGVKARLEARLWDVARISVEYQHDRVFESNVVFAGEIVFPGTRPRGRGDAYLTDRLGESVQRWRHVTLARSSTLQFF